MARTRFADLLAGADRTDEAIAEYRQPLRLSPKDRDTWFNLGANLYLRSLLESTPSGIEAAKQALEHALKLDPKDIRISALWAFVWVPNQSIVIWDRADRHPVGTCF